MAQQKFKKTKAPVEGRKQTISWLEKAEKSKEALDAVWEEVRRIALD